jgi:DNA-binding NtrC family response regulator
MKQITASSLVIIDDDNDLLEILSAYFRQKGFIVYPYTDARVALGDIEVERIIPDLVICDVKLPVMSGLDFVKSIKNIDIVLPIILMTAEGSLEMALNAIEAGAYDFVLKPLQVPQLLIAIQKVFIKKIGQVETTKLKKIVNKNDFFGSLGIIGKSPEFTKVMMLAQRVSSAQANIIIFGESGTGKEIVAKLIHQLGDRKSGPFIAINCSAIPENLLESELFGHTKGAFTGAIGSKTGLFEEANQGTLFLDEIGDLSLPLQAKLLRVLQERKIKRIGENKEREISARIICATHKDLKKEVERGNFREDLYFRLSVIPIFIPALRERKEDIILLSEFFLKKFSLQNKINFKGFNKNAIERLEAMYWKGNVRELENTIERAVILSNSDYIGEEDLPSPDLPCQPETQRLNTSSDPDADSIIFNSTMCLDQVVKKYIEFKFKKNGFAKDLTAKELGIDRKTLYRKLKEIANTDHTLQ